MPRVLRHQLLNVPGYDPTARRPVRLVARDVDRDARFPTHHHRWHQVLYTATGAVRVSTRDTTWFVPPSRAIWIPRGIDHAVATLTEAHMRSLYVLPAAVAQRTSRGPEQKRASRSNALAAVRVGAPRSSALPVDACRVIDVTPLMRELIAELGTDATENDPRREHLVAALILDELQAAHPLAVGVALPADKRLATLCRALIAEPASARTLDEWGTEVGASARTLARLFADELGTTFAAWRQTMRLAHAAPLVARGWPLSQVASELGYASQSAFSAMFRRRFGKSPSAFFAEDARGSRDAP